MQDFFYASLFRRQLAMIATGLLFRENKPVRLRSHIDESACKNQYHCYFLPIHCFGYRYRKVTIYFMYFSLPE